MMQPAACETRVTMVASANVFICVLRLEGVATLHAAAWFTSLAQQAARQFALNAIHHLGLGVHTSPAPQQMQGRRSAWALMSVGSRHSDTATTSSTAPRLTVCPRTTRRSTIAGAMYVSGAASPVTHAGVTHSCAVPSARSNPVTPWLNSHRHACTPSSPLTTQCSTISRTSPVSGFPELQSTNLSSSELDAGRSFHDSSTAPPLTVSQP